MDGNGRWAKERGKERFYGHLEGVESVRACVKAAKEAGVRHVSFFAFSEENWGRPEDEVVNLMELVVKAMHQEVPELNRQGVRFLVRGNIERLGDEVRAAIRESEEMTAANDELTVMVLLSYSGKWDILQAAKKMAIEMAGDTSRIENVGLSDFDGYLSTAGIPDPDVIVRTSGESRISNYFLWQGAYSELYFTDILWPDFRRKEFMDVLEWYAGRDRRYGKLK